MAEEVRQVIGIDVTQAIAAVDQLQNKLDSFGAKLQGLATQFDKFNSAAQRAFKFGDINKNLSQTTRLLDQFGNPIQNINSAADAAERLGQSAKTAGAGIKAGFGKNTTASLTTATTRFGRLRETISSLGTRGVASLRATGSAISNFANKASKQVLGLSVGFQTFARIISTQLIIRGISAIQQAFSSAVSSARDFQLRISEIQTISQNSFATFDKAAESVREISDAFNLPLGEAGEGLYQVISNQIQGAANQMDVLRESAILAKVGVADFSSTVELVTGTINAFELAESDANRVSAVFFETVRLGRTRIEELANSFGTVAPLASEAGFRFEELAGAFATLTINGVDTAKAATQLRGVINAFLKPTKELKAVLDQAGFASGELALESIGLAASLQLLQDATGGSAAEMAKLIPRVRGLAGAQVLARNEGQNLAEAIGAIDNAARDLSAQKFEIRLETDAEKVERQINQLQNALTVDLGQSILGVIRGFLEFTNAGDNLTIAIKALIPAVAGAATILALYGGIAVAATIKNLALTKSFFALFTAANTSALGIAGAIGALALLGVGIATAISEGAKAAADASVKEIEKTVERAQTARLKSVRETRAKEVAAEKTAIRERTQALQGELASVRATLSQRTRIFTEENAKIQKDTKQTFDLILKINQNFLQNLSQERQQATEAAISAEQRIGDARAALADDQFGFTNKRFNLIQQSVNLEQRASQLGLQAATALGNARTEEQIQSAQALAQRAQGFQQEAAAVAEQTNNLTLISRIQKSNVGLQRTLIRGEQIQADLQRQRAADLALIEDREQNRVQLLNEAIQKAGELSNQLKLGGEIVDRKDILSQLRETLGQVRTLSVPESGKLNISEILSFAEFERDILEGTRRLSTAGVDIGGILEGTNFSDFETRFSLAVSEATTEGLRLALEAGIPLEAVQAAAGQAGTDAPFAALDALVDAVNEVGRREQQIVENAAKLARAAEDMALATEQATSIARENRTLLEGLRDALTLAPRVVAELTEIGAKKVGLQQDTIQATFASPQLEAFQAEIVELPSKIVGQSAETANAVLQDFNQRFTEFTNRLGLSARLALAAPLTRTERQIQVINEAIQQASQSGTLTTDQIRQQLDGVKEVGAAANQNISAAKVAAEGMAVASSATAQQLSGAASSAQAIETALRNASQQQLSLGGNVGGSAIGRFFPKFLAGGGFSPRGTDSIPAMLSPGEFVVNARSTKRFFSQLQAMNAGVQPIFRQDGGAVTNVGDINVTVNGGTDADGTGRTIARRIRRELRRGTSSL